MGAIDEHRHSGECPSSTDRLFSLNSEAVSSEGNTMNYAKHGRDVLHKVGRVRVAKGLLPWVLCTFAMLVPTPKAWAQG